jgi:epoxyqueuosine reductase
MAEVKLNEIEEAAASFTEKSSLNKIEALGALKLFDAPLLAVAHAYDPLFTRLTEEDAVGPQHLLPQEWLEGARSVISYFLPFTKTVREANRTLGVAAKEWMYGRYEGEQFNNALRKHLVEQLENKGVKVVSPGIDPRFTIVKRRSNWSERHVAFIAGMGTFSLSRSLITRHGSAGRIGSVIVDVSIEPTTRQYTAIDEYCVKCGACILRCPPLAINEQGKDNAVCSDYLDRVFARYKPRYGCGKCQTSVPCEFKIPHTSVSNSSNNNF